MIGTWHALVIDCEDIETAADFYAELAGLDRVGAESDESWIVLRRGSDGPRISFQKVEKLTPPQWPGAEHPQQMHLDVRVDDLNEGEKNVLDLGAQKQGYEEEDFRVYLDPAGHPFCLVSS